MEHLKGLSGLDFDKAYIKEMVRDHMTDVKEFHKEAEKGDDAELKAWVVKMLPTLQEHLKMAQNAESTIAQAK